jgi:general secretion pathway protein I
LIRQRLSPPPAGTGRRQGIGARTGCSGFTLLEVLVALGILALTMGAVISAAGSYTKNQSYLRDRTLALWAARNVLAEQQLENAWPRVGELKGTLEMGQREWRWVATVTQTEERELRRLDIEVYPLDIEDDTRSLAVLSGFLQQPSGTAP